MSAAAERYDAVLRAASMSALVAAADGKYHVTLHGLNGETPTLSFADTIRCVVMDDAEDLAFEVERFKRDWRKRGQPFDWVTVEVEQNNPTLGGQPI